MKKCIYTKSSYSRGEDEHLPDLPGKRFMHVGGTSDVNTSMSFSGYVCLVHWLLFSRKFDLQMAPHPTVVIIFQPNFCSSL